MQFSPRFLTVYIALTVLSVCDALLETRRHEKRETLFGFKRDLLVIIDSSSAVGSANFRIVKDQIARLLGLLCPANDPFERRKNLQRAALIEYSSTVKQVFDFDDKENTEQIQQTIKSLDYMGQSTCTAAALREAEITFNINRGMRTASDVKQEVLILTGGLSNCGGNATEAARKLQEKAEVCALRIGNYTAEGVAELQSYVSETHNKHLFAIDGYQVLKHLLDEIEFMIGQPGYLPCAPLDLTMGG